MALRAGYISLVALLALALAAMPGRTADANGQVSNFVSKTAGPYEIVMGTSPASPTIGSLHIAVLVNDLATRAPVLDARVMVTGRGPGADAAQIGPVEAQRGLTSAAFYEVNTSVDRIGQWVFTLNVEGRLGQASAQFPIEVREPNPIMSIFATVVGVIALLVLGYIWFSLLRWYLRRRGHGSPRRKAAR